MGADPLHTKSIQITEIINSEQWNGGKKTNENSVLDCFSSEVKSNTLEFLFYDVVMETTLFSQFVPFY